MGFPLIYLSMALVALMGFCSLPVDSGRVQTAKTGLEWATDAAARAAAASISSGVTAAQNAEYNVALANAADGSAVVAYKTNDVVFLN